MVRETVRIFEAAPNGHDVASTAWLFTRRHILHDRAPLNQQRVLRELLDGITNITIAKQLRISDKTIKNHVSHIWND